MTLKIRLVGSILGIVVSVMAEGSSEYIIRVMRKEEIAQALDIWKETGMQEGTGSLHTWLQVDPECFQVAVSPSGELLGVCSGVILNEDLAFFGLYAVREKCRGLGIGPKLWKACLSHIGDINAAVNAVPGKLEVYRDRGGFPVEETTWSCLIYETAAQIDFSPLTSNIPGVKVVKISDKDMTKVLEYDFEVVGFNREKAISLIVNEKDSVAVAAFEDSPEGKIKGYGVLKMSVQGSGLVGPLYADNQEIAEVLLRNMMESLPEARGMSLMSTDVNPGAEAIAKKLGIPEFEKCPRCYRKRRLNANLSKIYGQLDLNFSPF